MRPLYVTERKTNRGQRSLDKYLLELAPMPVLTPQEEVRLVKLAKSGDKSARETLVKANLKFVVSVAKTYSNRYLSLGDLINEGNDGLLEGIEKFDETRGFKLISSAVWHIRQRILKAIQDHGKLVRTPTNITNGVHKMEKSITKLEGELGRPPTNEELFETLKLSKLEFNSIARSRTTCVSLDGYPSDQEMDGMTLGEVIPQSLVTSPDYNLESQSIKEDIVRILDVYFTDFEKEILLNHFNLVGEFLTNWDDIAARHGKTPWELKKAKRAALKKLQDSKIKSAFIRHKDLLDN